MYVIFFFYIIYITVQIEIVIIHPIKYEANKAGRCLHREMRLGR